MNLIQLVVSITHRCNSRCLTCLEWKTPESAQRKELTLTQYQKVFQSWQGKIPYLNLVGGEAFLREDLPQIALLAARLLKPKTINIATNGLLPEKIGSDIEQILKKIPKKITVMANLSIDGIEKIHNQTRGGKNFFKKLTATHQVLKKLQKDYQNLKISFHTGISIFNKKGVSELVQFLKKINPQSYILEPACDRAELLKTGIKVQISSQEFKKIFKNNKAVIWKLNQNTSWPLRLARFGYYPFALETMEKNSQVIPCQAASCSLFLNPYGYLSACELRKPFTNIAYFKYNLRQAFLSQAAEKQRKQIKDNQCFCHSSYYYYSSIKNSPLYLLKILGQIF